MIYSSKRKTLLIVVFLVLTLSLGVSGCVDKQGRAEFEVTNLEINPRKVGIDENASVSVKVSNIGNASGTKTIELNIENKVQKTKEITLAPNETKEVVFPISIKEAGGYVVEIEDLSAPFQVLGPNLVFSDYKISRKEVLVGQRFNVSINASNKGEIGVVKTIKLKANEESVKEKRISLKENQSERILFRINFSEPGVFNLAIANYSKTIEVKPNNSSTNQSYSISLIEVTDGDTIKIEYSNGSQETVRLLGVDTPEVYGENDPSEFEGIEEKEYLREWGHRASDYTKTLLINETITLKFDNESDKRGYYDRLLAYVYLENDSCLNKLLIIRGFARVYEEAEFSKRQMYLEVEKRARENYTGLWKKQNESNQTPSGSLVIVDARFDAPGNDHENPNGEWIKIKNKGTRTKNIQGYRLTDADDHVFFFPSTSLAKGESLFVYTGKGENNETAIYWGLEAAIWNNGGDTAYLYNSTDLLVDSYKRP